MKSIDIHTQTLNVITLHNVNSESYHPYLKQELNWIYLNTEANRCSKIRARINAAGYLVIGEYTHTRIVCLKDHQLYYSDDGCAEAVRFNDPCIFVFSDKRGRK